MIFFFYFKFRVKYFHIPSKMLWRTPELRVLQVEDH
jgi:hypothetical protein